MSTLTIYQTAPASFAKPASKAKRIESIDLLRGIVMIIMAIDHVRHFFHHDALLYEPTDLGQTSVVLFFTRWITHFCAPIFVFLAGVSSYLYGINKSRKELAYYLFSRGLWLVFVELFIISLEQTFNPSYPVVVLQVIWATGISMMVLSGLIYLKRPFILAIAILLIVGHNLLDNIHVPGTGLTAFTWSVLHEPADFVVGHVLIIVKYPVLPWISILTMGYYLGFVFSAHYNPEKRMKLLLLIGFIALELFFFLRTINMYGNSSHWTNQKNVAFSLLSFLNVTKYPPSLLYTLVTLGPAVVFLALADKPLNSFTRKIAVFGRVPFFYYVIHFFLIHLMAMFGAVLLGFSWSDMILNNVLGRVPSMKSYGFNLLTVYLVWVILILVLYPCCKWYDRYKRSHLPDNPWLTYV
jgi:uncharacterized membrane protein